MNVTSISSDKGWKEKSKEERNQWEGQQQTKGEYVNTTTLSGTGGYDGQWGLFF